MNITLAQLQQIMPNASVAKLNTYLPHINTYLQKYGLDTPKIAAAFLATVSEETGDLKFVSEIWGPSTQQNRYEGGTSLAIGMGNLNTGDGRRYKGRGLIQLTGKNNYKAFSSVAGINAELEPDLILQPIYGTWSSCWIFSKYKGIIKACNEGNFLRVSQIVNGGPGFRKLPYNYDKRVAAYNRASAALQTGLYIEGGSGLENTNTASTSSNVEGQTGSINNTFNQSLDFSKVAQNIDTQELDDTDVTWGSRSTPEEESDYIGLKQYIVYLITRYYPQSLMPFVELIPNFETNSLNPDDDASPEEKKTKATVGDLFAKSTGMIISDVANGIRQKNTQDKIVDEDRYNRTQNRLKKLNETGGTDIGLVDPFQEFSESFNVPNDEGKSLAKKRNLSYKIYGNLVLNPSAENDALSKPGAIGLKSISIEQGSQTQNGLSLITVKILDVQGNKLLDVNSPWSLLLNMRSSDGGGDFYFRYGWQIRIPKYNPDNNYRNDPQAGKFWNHIGWAGLFFARSGENTDKFDKAGEIKKYISGLAAKSDNTLTLTQSPNSDSIINSGYENFVVDGKVNFRVKRNLKELGYLSLSLISPEINVNPKDGSIEATLIFRTNAALANCLCPLNCSTLKDKFTRSLVSSSLNTTLTELMRAFVKDNYAFAVADPNLNNAQSNKLYFANEPNIENWLSVIGGIGSDSQLFINPNDIKVVISTEQKDDIINAKEKDTRLLIEWLNKVLYENKMAITVAAENSKGSQLADGFVIAYDNDSAQPLSGTTKTNAELGKKDPTFGDYLQMVEPREGENYIGKRLFSSDDVFSFKFQGSLIEEINIEKLSASNAATIEANKSFAETQGNTGDKSDVNKKEGDATDNGVPVPKTSKVTIQDKKRNLNILYTNLLGLKVKAICHPWLKICRPCYVKGMGFFDGKYTILKIVHELGDDGRFSSTINATRIPNTNLIETKTNNNAMQQTAAMYNPGAYVAEKSVGKVPAGSAVKPTAPNASLPASFQNQINPNKAFTTEAFLPTKKVSKLRANLETEISILHSSYQDHFRSFISDFEASRPGFKVLITSGYRSFAKQASLKAENDNNARPGHSTHNYGLSIDINVVQGNIVIARKDSADAVWEGLGILQIASKYGLTWGGNSFGNYKDRVHFGLDKTFNTDILLNLARIQFGNIDSNVKGNKLDFGF